MTKESLLKVIREKRMGKIPDLLDGCFPQQIKFINDPSKKKVALIARRGAKSTSICIMLFLQCLNNPKSVSLFLSMTSQTCMNILYPIAKPLADKFELDVQFNHGNHPEIKFKNGSSIKLVGLDSSERQMKKILGQKPRMVVIDEAQDILINVSNLINSVLTYALSDYGGQLIMAGTPSDYTSTYFYETTKDYKSVNGWSFHRWEATDNPYMRQQLIQKEKEDELENPLYKDTNYYKQMSKGLWCINSNSLVYRPKDHNFIDKLPPEIEYRTDWIYILGVDFGYTDADGFCVIGWLPDDKHLYILEAHVQSGNDDFNTANTIKRLSQQYNFSHIVVDGSSKKTMETLKERFNLPLEATEKVKKYDFISLFNQDLDTGIIKILPQPKEKLMEEWSKLIWDPKKTRFEKEGLANHCSDSALYGWRKALNWASIEPIADLRSEEEKYIEWAQSNKKKTDYEYLQDQSESIEWDKNDF